MSLNKIESTFAKPLVAGALAGGVIYFMYPNVGSVFSSVPAWVLAGGLVAGSTFVGEIGGNYVLPKVLPMAGGQLAGLVTTAVNPAMVAGFNVLGNKFLASSQYEALGAVKLGLIGGGAYVAADYLTKNVLHLNF